MAFFKFFVYGLFPIPLILLGLLLLPFPRIVHNQVLKLTDKVLFYQPHPNIKLSLFWLCFGITLAAVVLSYQSYDDKKSTYYKVKEHGGNSDVALTRLLGAERNIWIATTGTVLWFVLHRYRSLLKKFLLSESKLDKTKNK